MPRFDQYTLSQESLAALEAISVYEPTSVQELALPPMLEGKDVMAQAPTGTGKTYAFGLPIVERCQEEAEHPQALILAPTRELAQQIDREIKLLSSTRPWLQSVVLYGGQSMRQQIAALNDHPAIVTATPGRLLDLMQRNKINLSQIKICILDEADRMLDMGFVDDVRKILDKSSKNAQIAMFSATFSRDVMDISWLYQHHPVEVRVEAREEDKPDIREFYVMANGVERIEAIQDILKLEALDRALIFVNTKQSAEMAARKLKALGYRTGALQGDMAQKQRNLVMRAFREGELDILVGTDVAARGLDIDDIELVINYDLPLENENYIHRIGRTGRARKKGLAFSFVAPGGEKQFWELMRKLHSEPCLYEWSPKGGGKQELSDEATEAVIRRVRENSQWLREGKDKNIDPLAAYRRQSGARSFSDRKGGGRRSSAKSPSPATRVRKGRPRGQS